MVAKKTRKVNKKTMTVPQLRRAFDHIDSYVAKNPSVEGFCKEWKKTFGKEVSKAAAKEYLNFAAAAAHKKKQRGGAMSPAPLGYDMRAGLDNYGSFPEYVSDGFGFANKDSIAAVCGTENIGVNVPAGLGSNLVGGKRRKGSKTRKSKKQRGGATTTLGQLSNNFSEFLSRPFSPASVPTSWNSVPATFPPSAAQGLPSHGFDIQMLSKGYATNTNMPSPRPEIPVFNFDKSSPTYAAYASPSSVRV
jgi:hypothetical protein